MPNLQKTVGAKGTNDAHDVSLVQVMLKVVKNAKGVPYFNANYTGTLDAVTTNAIVAFQKDKALLPVAKPPAAGKPGGPPAPPGPPGGAAPAGGAAETEGLIGPATKTFTTLVASLPADYANVRAMTGVKTIYIEAAQADADASAKTTSGDPVLDPGFRTNVAALIDAMFSTHKIALWVEPVNGRTRGFEQQNVLLGKGTTAAGPGESNHNWGFAVDIGFKAFKWVSGDASFVVDDFWLNKLAKVKGADSTTMWTTRNGIATTKTLFKTTFAGDLIHLQNFDDTGINMRRSLAAQLTRVGKFKWEFEKGSYTTDMGSGAAKLEPVGTATKIWTKDSTPSKELVAGWKTALEKAAWAKLKQPEKDAFNKAALAKLPKGAPAPAAPDPGLKVWEEADVANPDIDAAKAALRVEMNTAEAKRSKWQPTK